MSRFFCVIIALFLGISLSACQSDGPLDDDRWQMVEGKLESFADRDGSTAWRLVRPGLITGSTILIDSEGSSVDLARHRGQFVRIAGESTESEDGRKRFRAEFISPSP